MEVIVNPWYDELKLVHVSQTAEGIYLKPYFQQPISNLTKKQVGDVM